MSVKGFDPEKIYALGEKGSGIKPRGDIQVFKDLLHKHLQEGKLFEDPQFAPKSIDLGEYEKKALVEWKRPTELILKPHLIVEGFSRFDVVQGNLGDCWFLAATATLAENPKWMNIICPNDQDFEKNYAGIFHFRFWQYGRWLDVVIDDRLPTVDNALVFLKSTDRHEFWTALLEKAYAKLNGSYAKLEGGLTSEALQDLTGGLSALYQIKDTPNIRDIMCNSYNKMAFMGCAIITGNIEDNLGNGLLGGHAYTITKLAQIKEKKNVLLIRIRNPWGQNEWTGDWSDKSQTWNEVSETTRTELRNSKEDGEFWMSYEDFIKNFTFIECCYRDPNSFSIYNKSKAHWYSVMLDGCWITGINNGGSNKVMNMCQNPQYLLTVDPSPENDIFTVIVSVTQKFSRMMNVPNHMIGCYVFKSSSNENVKLNEKTLQNCLCVGKIEFNYSKQVVTSIDLRPGKYYIIPCAKSVQKSAEFLLRIYSTAKYSILSIDDEVICTNPTKDMNTIPEENPSLWNKTFCRPQNDILDWQTLRDSLNSGGIYSFTENQCRELIANFDSDYSGKLNLEEYRRLCLNLCSVKITFSNYDTDKSSGISMSELSKNLKDEGISLSSNILKLVITRYGNEKNELEFVDYLLFKVKLNNLLETYKNNQIKLSLEKWLQCTLYC